MHPLSLAVIELPKVLDWLAGLTSFSAGRELALALQPSTDLSDIELRLQATGEAVGLLDARPALHLGGAHDIRPLAQRAALDGLLTPEELQQIADTLAVAGRWSQSLARLADFFPVLSHLAGALEPEQGLRSAIENAIGEDGQVLDSASPQLRQVRTDVRAAHDRLTKRLQELLTTPSLRQALQEPIVTQRDGRYVLPVKVDYRGQVRGVVHDQSASGATLFVEPLEVMELANRWRMLQRVERDEIERVLQALSQRVAQSAGALDRDVEILAQIDLARAKAHLAQQLDAVPPAIGELPAPQGEPALKLVDARHPLLERTLGRERVVPISLELGAEFDVLLITGPNTGGKTVALKTVGLLAAMAQSGLFLPSAEGSRVPAFTQIYADIGDEQSIEQSLSTFSSHMVRIVEILRHADANSLVLLDELGAGTDPEEGAALARALVDELRARRTYVVATTHYSELKAYAHATSRVQNASVEFDVQSLAPTFRLSVGTPGQSNALAIAARLGLPGDLVGRARQLLRPQELEVSAMIEQLRRDRKAAEAQLATAEQARTAAELYRDRLRAELEETAHRREQAWKAAEAESEHLLADLQRDVRLLRRELERLGRQQNRAPSTSEVTELAARVEALHPLRAPRPVRPSIESPAQTDMRVGREVFVASLGTVGTVLSLDRDDLVTVSVGGMRVQVSGADLQSAADGEHSRSRPEPRRDVLIDVEARHVAAELDVRGLRRDEALAELDRYINDAYMAGLPRVRVIHGKGTGAVRAAVRDLLAGHPLVREFAAAERSSGGDGATEVALVV